MTRFSIQIHLRILAVMLCLPMTADAGTVDAKKCIGALNAFQKSIKNGKSGIDYKWPRGIAGSVLLKLKEPHEPLKELNAFVGKPRDIFSCTEFGVPAYEIDLFLRAFHGYLPENPHDGLAQCYSVMLTAAPEMERVLGADKYMSLGSSLGERFEVATMQLNYLYSSKKRGLETISAQAKEISTALSKLTASERTRTLQTNKSQCEIYGIPLVSTLEGAGVAIK